MKLLKDVGLTVALDVCDGEDVIPPCVPEMQEAALQAVLDVFKEVIPLVVALIPEIPEIPETPETPETGTRPCLLTIDHEDSSIIEGTSVHEGVSGNWNVLNVGFADSDTLIVTL